MKPLLYTFLRCPYAIRARMAIAQAGLLEQIDIVEVSLRDKPPAMLALSPKGTVPVLQLPDGRVIDESLDIMRWALSQHDPAQWLRAGVDSDALIVRNDVEFKPLLDRYKYAERHPELSREQHREAALVFLVELDERLQKRSYLCDDQACIADAALMPFVRQFSRVEPEWFASSSLVALSAWLSKWTASPLFEHVMKKTAPTAPSTADKE